MFVVGSIPGLGSWKPEASIELPRTSAGLGTEQIVINSEQDARAIEYKYLTCSYDRATRQRSHVDWEHADNRRIDLRDHFHTALKKKSSHNVQQVVIVEDKGFNDRRHGWPKIRTEEVPIAGAETYPA